MAGPYLLDKTANNEGSFLRIVLVWPHTHTAGSEDTRAVIHTPSCRRCFPQGISWVTFISTFEFYGIQAFCKRAAVKQRNLQQELQFAVSSQASRHVSVYPCALLSSAGRIFESTEAGSIFS